VLLVALALGAGYALGARRVPRTWPWTRTAAFFTGCAVLGASSLWSTASFTGHMLEHVAVGMAAPVLLVLGAPVTLALQAGDGRQLRRWLRAPLARMLTNPVIAWVLFGTTLVALVFSPLLGWSVRYDAVHALVHVHFLVVGSIFASTMLAIDPLPHPPPHGARLLAVLLAVPFHAIVGMALVTASRPLFPSLYPSLSDQRSAAAVVWASGELFTFAVAAIVARQWWLADQREGVRLDRRSAF
jgi:cytochrome c oxidase assembly factor CtaG